MILLLSEQAIYTVCSRVPGLWRLAVSAPPCAEVLLSVFGSARQLFGKEYLVVLTARVQGPHPKAPYCFNFIQIAHRTLLPLSRVWPATWETCHSLGLDGSGAAEAGVATCQHERLGLVIARVTDSESFDIIELISLTSALLSQLLQRTEKIAVGLSEFDRVTRFGAAVCHPSEDGDQNGALEH